MSDSPISRTNFSPNTVLTSTELNSQFNTVYDRANDLDGFFIQDETITKAKLAAGAMSDLSVTSKTADYTATSDDRVILCDSSSGALTIFLPTAIGSDGLVFNVKKTDSSVNTVTVNGNGSETIDGSLTKVLYSRWDHVKICSDGTNWVILENGVKNRYQKRVLTADVSSSLADVTDLKFTSLVVGRRYRVDLTAEIETNPSTRCYVRINTSSTEVAFIRAHSNGGSGSPNSTYSTHGYFTAESTDLITVYDEDTSNTNLIGAGGQRTWITVTDVTEQFVETTELD